MAITTMNLSSLDGKNGFRLNVVERGYFGGVTSVSAGDVNADGFSDVIVGAGSANSIAGVTYVVFGKADGFDAVFKVSSLDGNNGFSLKGEESYDVAGWSVSGAGDFNGDGFEDVIVGAPGRGGYGPFSSSSYVVFGKASGFGATLNLSSLDGNNGFRLDGVALDDYSGYSVSRAGDINGDGFDDVIIGAPGAGTSYVIFGKASGFDAAMNLSNLDGSNGFRFNGSGNSVSNAGDINGDGFEDVIIGAPGANSNGSGSSYIIFGKAPGFGAALDLSALDGENGFRVDGVAAADVLGESVSSVGDVNGDGFDDVIIGAPGADPNGQRSGSSYVIFGKATGFEATMNLSSLDGSNGFRLDGISPFDFSGSSVGGTGDFNADGFDDVIIDSSYLIFGKASGFGATLDLSSLDSDSGLRLDGEGVAVSSAGDVNNDGFNDLILGSTIVDYTRIAFSYVVFGTNHLDGTLTYVGTPENDVFSGTPVDELFEGNDGNDTLIGRGGKDVFKGEDGDDVIEVLDLGFQTLDGGIGTDTLKLNGAGIHLNLADFHDTINNIETIDLTGSGDNTVTFTLPDLFSLSETSTFTIDGNAGDRVIGIGNGWAEAGIDGDYRVFTNRGTVVRVDAGVYVNSPAGVMSVSSLNGSNGFRMDGESRGDFLGFSVSNAGDVNGDGFDDVIIGAPYADPNGDWLAGSGYVVFGKASGFDAEMHLSSLDGNNGFRLDGEAEFDIFGKAVSSAGDLNGDGFDDVIIGAPWAPNGGRSGSTYVLFGTASGFSAEVNLSNLNGNNGFRLDGSPFDDSGDSVSSAGDVNGDGLADVIIAAPGSDGGYVVFGKASGLDGGMSLSSLDGSNGFRLSGITSGNSTGESVSSAGDFNGDGFDDLIVGASPVNYGGSGSSYVIFGKAAGFAATLDLSRLNGSNGFRLDGEPQFIFESHSVSNAGDINGDGFDDVIVGVRYASLNMSSSYVVFGKASGFDAVMNLSSIDGTNGFRLNSKLSENTERRDLSVSNAGDFNGDGFDDLIIGNYEGGPYGGGRYFGASYVVYGKVSDFDATLDLSTLDGKNGFRLDGTPGDKFGSSVSSAGDVNGDGFDDLLIGAKGLTSNNNFSGSSYIVFGRSNSGGSNVIAGTPDDDLLRGTSAAELFEAGDGNDILIGRGGADVFRGGAGVDQIKVPDLNFASIDGGVGTDILHLDGKDLHLDLANVG
ncbi:hypothetical protein ABF87_13085, partial [Nitrosomonas sp. JL21]|uniref:beta strand repeat-containing protein n=1 Tax=Nitrosomonas sp. JL21 TaxID=153949 RepID=UPI00136CF0FA